MQTTSVMSANHKPSPFEAVAALLRERGLRFAEFWFTDLGGRPWRIAMAAGAVNEGLFTSGLPLDGQPVGGSWDGVMLLQPRLDALYPDPAASAPTLAMFCDVLDPDTRDPLALEPRHVLARAVKEAERRLDAEMTLGIEPEFMLLDPRGRPLAEAPAREFLRELAVALADAGIQIDWFRTGPATGQGRVQMRAGSPLLMADRVMLYRHVAASLARSKGLIASFLPRPVAGEGAPGMPMHLAAWKDGRNLFHDDGGWALTSRLCRSFAGGILTHLPALLALCAPSTNSYRRLIPGVSGPTEGLLSTTRRAAACRIPARNNAPGARRVKFCAPDATANPYLAIAAVLLAGLDGIDRDVEAPYDGHRPLSARIPHCLEAALDALEADKAFLGRGAVFTDALIEAWAKDRWARHILPVRSRPHPWELAHGDHFARVDSSDPANNEERRP